VSGIDRLVAWNGAHAPQAATPTLGAKPLTSVAIVTCMDARISTRAMLGVNPGDVHVIRNAGGIVTDDVMRSLIVSQVALGTSEVMVIQHTGCGMEGLDDDAFRERLRLERGAAPAFIIGGFVDVHQRVVESVRALRANPLIVAEVRGFIFAIETGLVAETIVD
jgi:carbonic anhydrase